MGIVYCGMLPAGALVSLLVGLRLCGGSTPLQRLGGWLTLKPFVATPLWALTLNLAWVRPDSPTILVTALPGVGLTVLVLLIYWSRLSRADMPRLRTLLLLDTIRWGSSVLLFVNLGPAGWVVAGAGLFVVSLAMPLVFAVAAWEILRESPSASETL